MANAGKFDCCVNLCADFFVYSGQRNQIKITITAQATNKAWPMLLTKQLYIHIQIFIFIYYIFPAKCRTNNGKIHKLLEIIIKIQK